MTHPLRLSELSNARSIRHRQAAVTVRREKDALVIVPGAIGILKEDALVEPVPSRLRVTSENGDVVKPSSGKMFVITTETFDPHHCVAEVPIGRF